MKRVDMLKSAFIMSLVTKKKKHFFLQMNIKCVFSAYLKVLYVSLILMKRATLQ